VLADAAGLPCLMTNLLGLLKEGGRIEMSLQNPQSISNPQKKLEASSKVLEVLSQFTDYFWHSGWFNHRLEIESIKHTENPAYIYNQTKGQVLKVILKKVSTTLSEKTAARAMMTDFENISSDIF
jgi:hypothetical protein